MRQSKRVYTILFVMLILSLTALACSLGAQGKDADDNPVETNQSSPTTQATEPEVKVSFPIPSQCKVIQSGPDLLIGQVKMSIDDLLAFYRRELDKSGLKEDALYTSITDTTFSLVFKGSSNGKDLILQGTDMGEGSVSFSIRYE